MPSVHVTHYSDPGCPWAYSASPALALLKFRFGAQLEWRHVMIGLTEHRQQYLDRGYTAATMANTRIRFRPYGMPFGGAPKRTPIGTARMCRAVVATRLAHPEREEAVFRALQFTNFTTHLELDDDAAVEAALRAVPGIDVAAIVAALDDDAVTKAYEADRADARSAAGSATEVMNRHANTDGAPRYTAPTLIFTTQDGRRFDAGGFQPWQVYDTVLANLAPELERRPVAGDPLEALEAFQDGLTAMEVAQLMSGNLDIASQERAEAVLLELAAAGTVRRIPLGDDGLWQLVSSPEWGVPGVSAVAETVS